MIDNAFDDLNTKNKWGLYNRLEHALNNNLFSIVICQILIPFQDTDFGNELANENCKY